MKPALIPENASLLEELSGVEMLGTPGAKLGFPDGGQLLAQSPSPNVLVEEPAHEPRRLLAKIDDGGVLDVTGRIVPSTSSQCANAEAARCVKWFNQFAAG